MKSTFPHRDHRKALHEKYRDAKKHEFYLGNMMEEDRWQYHAYDYGWRKVWIEHAGDRSPVDPDRVYYDQHMAELTEAMFRTERATIENRFRRRPQLFAPVAPDPQPRDPLAEVREAMGVSAVETPGPGQ